MGRSRALEAGRGHEQDHVHGVCPLLQNRRGQAGLCGIRGVHEGKLWLYVYGRVITATSIRLKRNRLALSAWVKDFSIATTGCNWLCKYCQNSDISQRRKVEGIEVEPQDVVA